MIYAVLITIAGVAVGVGSYLKGWGAGGYVLAGIFMVSGISMIAKKLQGGLNYLSVTCPACEKEQTWAEEALEDGRVVPCQQCLRYLERKEGSIVLVNEDRVEREPIFGAPCPKGDIHWGGGCALCGQTRTAWEEVEGQALKMGVASNKRIIRKIETPVCAAHQGQKAVELTGFGDLPGDLGFSLYFRSYARCLEFRERNPTQTKVTGNLTFGRT